MQKSFSQEALVSPQENQITKSYGMFLEVINLFLTADFHCSSLAGFYIIERGWVLLSSGFCLVLSADGTAATVVYHFV